jgi:ferredoxin
VQRGLSASHVTLTPTLIRVPPPTEVARRTLTRAEELRNELLTTKGAPPPKIELLRACIAAFVLFVFSSRGGAEIDCFTCDIFITQQGGIITYHRDKKGQRRVTAEHRLQCAIYGGTHHRIASDMLFSDSYRLRRSSTSKNPFIVGRSTTAKH